MGTVEQDKLKPHQVLWRLAAEHVQQAFSDDQRTIFEELQKSSQALAESEARYRRILTATSSFVFSVAMESHQRVVTLFETGVEAVTGYSAQDHVQDTELWHRMIHPDDRPRVSRHIDALHDGRPVSMVEHRIYHRDGRLRWLRNTSITRKDEHGKLAGYDGMVTDVTALKEAEEQRDALLKSLRELACSDVMTGLPNRRGFNEELHRAWNMALRHQVMLGILIMDLDHFKSINDTYGHLVGDEVLKEYAAMIKPALRESDAVCRYAGDELVVILPWADREVTQQIGERILKQIEQHVFLPHHLRLHLTASIGGHADLPKEGVAPAVFINQADRALYRAKGAGRGCMCMSTAHEAESKAPPHLPELHSEERGVVLIFDADQQRIPAIQAALSKLSMKAVVVGSESAALKEAGRQAGRVGLLLFNGNIREPVALQLVDRLHEQNEWVVPLWLSGAQRHGSPCESIWDQLPEQVESPAWSAGIRRAMECHRLLVENRRYESHLEAMVNQKDRLLSQALEQAERSYGYSLETMAQVISVREQHTAEHCQRVARMAVILAEEMGLSPSECEQIRSGALLHDIGKIGIPDAILLKPGPLTDGEWSVMQKHPDIGCRIVSGIPALNPVSDIVLSHHEHYDGSGYPRGLRGEEICWGARIFAVVDAYDTMRAQRCYANPVSEDEALQELVRQKGRQFDPAVVDAFIRRHADLEAAFSLCPSGGGSGH